MTRLKCGTRKRRDFDRAVLQGLKELSHAEWRANKMGKPPESIQAPTSAKVLRVFLLWQALLPELSNRAAIIPHQRTQMDSIYNAMALARNAEPITLLFLLGALGICLARRRRWAYWLALSAFACLFTIATPVGMHGLVHFIAKTEPLDRSGIGFLPKANTMLVVLTGGKQRAAEYPNGETLSVASLERARYAASLARQTGLPLAISGGLPGATHHSEAAVTKDFIESELGHEVALIEEESRNTRESALRMSRMLKKADIPTVVLVTHSIHMPRAARAFESAGVTVISAPMGVSDYGQFQLAHLLPNAKTLYDSSAVIHEIVGSIWYRLLDAMPGETDNLEH